MMHSAQMSLAFFCKQVQRWKQQKKFVACKIKFGNNQQSISAFLRLEPNPFSNSFSEIVKHLEMF